MAVLLGDGPGESPLADMKAVSRRLCIDGRDPAGCYSSASTSVFVFYVAALLGEGSGEPP